MEYVVPPEAAPSNPRTLWADRIGHGAVLCMAASLPISRALFHVCALIMAACWLAGGHYRTLPALLRNSPPVAACVTLVVLVIASGLYTSASLTEWLVQTKAYAKLLAVPMMLPFLRRPDQIMRGWVALAFGLAALWLLFTVDRWVDIPGTRSARLGDQGVFNNYIVEGLNLGTLALIGLASAWHFRLSRPRLAAVFLIGALASAHAVFFVNPGRGAQLALFGALLVFTWVALRGRARWLGALAVFVLLSAAATQSEVMINRFKSAHEELRTLGTGPKVSVALRLVAWEASLRLWSDEPMLGHGAGSYTRLVNEREADYLGGCVNNAVCEQPHNQYVYFLVELGLAGLLAFGWILITVMRSGLGTDRMTGALAPAFCALFAIHSFFDSGLRMGTQVFIFLLMTGLLASAQLHRHPAPRSATG